MKFADHTEMVGKVSNDDDTLRHKQTENFVNWCDKNDLCFNVSRSKEMGTDFRKNQTGPKLSTLLSTLKEKQWRE